MSNRLPLRILQKARKGRGDTAFRMVVKTDNAGTSASNQFSFPWVAGGTYDVTAISDQGDIFTSNLYTNNTMTFAGGAGTYTIDVYGVLIGWAFNNGGDKLKYLKTLQVGVFDHNSETGAFYGCLNHEWLATDVGNLANSQSLNSFWRANPLVTLIPQLPQIWTSETTSVQAAFFDSGFNDPIIRQVVSTSTLSFTSAFRDAPFNQDISNLNFEAIDNTTRMLNMLSGSNFDDDNYELLLLSMLTQNFLAGQTPDFGPAKWKFGYGGQAKFDMLKDGSFSSVTDSGQADPTLSVWLNAHNLLKTSANPADGTAVATWSDLSDNANDAAQASSGNQPVFKTNIANGEPGVLWDGVNDRLDITDASSIQNIFNSATGGFCIAVFKAPTEGEVIGRIWSKHASDGSSIGNVLYLNNAGVPGKMDLLWQKDFSTNQGRWQAVEGIDTDQVMIVMYHYSGADVANDPTMYINSKTPFSLTESQTPIGTVKSDIGFPLNIGNANGTTRTFDGHIFELVLFKDKNPTTQEISDYFDYLAEKYGVTLS